LKLYFCGMFAFTLCITVSCFARLSACFILQINRISRKFDGDVLFYFDPYGKFIPLFCVRVFR
jgi:hypothetical protein